MTQNGNAPLNGKQIEQLANGLLTAFTGFNDLARVVLIALNEPLIHIVDQQANFKDQVWQLVQWADAKGKLRDFFRAAVAHVPGNVQLRAAAEAVFGKGVLDDLPPQLPASRPPSRPPSTENGMVSGDATNPQFTEEQVLDDFPAYKAEDQPWFTPLPALKDSRSEELTTLADEIDLVIMTATDVERDAVLRRLNPLPPRRKVLTGFVGPETYFVGRFGELNAVMTKCRMGSAGPGSATLAADQAQRIWRPRAIIMVGIAFGKDQTKQQYADVLVASEVIFYEQQRVGVGEIIQRGIIPPSNPTLLNRFDNAVGWNFIRPDGAKAACRLGPILSGEKLVDDLEFKASLFRTFPQAIGGEMEGAGLCAAAIRSSVPWILVKAICDWGDGKKRNKHQPLAAAAAVSLVHHVLSQPDVLHGLQKPADASRVGDPTARPPIPSA
jgi:nucleoside phosphorylase